MPDLPTITVTQAQADRILAAIQDQLGGATTAEATSFYKKWLAKQIKSFVLAYERKQIENAANAQAATLWNDIDGIINENNL